jgi:hypothetical protein
MIESPIKTTHGLALCSPRDLNWDFDKHYQWDGWCAQVGIVPIVPARQLQQFRPHQLKLNIHIYYRLFVVDLHC